MDDHTHLTSIEISQQLLDEALSTGTITIVGATDDGRVLYQLT